jgi:NAD(P)-dependent dehydrogenase (short-subunit alcohol dehydrogenase family)
VAAGIRAGGGTAAPCKVDVSRPASASGMAALADDRFGGIDYLVNTASVLGNMKLDPLLNVDWEAVPDVFVDQIVSTPALKRRGTPGDLVGMCQFLLSDDANWVTGSVVNVDGGQVMRP